MAISFLTIFSFCFYILFGMVIFVTLCDFEFFFFLLVSSPDEEASNVLDVTNIKHLSEDKELIGDVVKKITDDWNEQKENFYKQTGCGEDEMDDQELQQLLLDDNEDNED